MAATSKLTMLIDMSTKMFNSKLAQLQGKWSQTVGKMEAKYSEFINRTGAGNLLDKIKNPAAGLLMAGTAIAGFMGKSTQMANEWHTKMAEINVTAGLTKTELSGLSDQLLDIGARNVAPLDEVPKAFNRIISAGLSVKESLTALEPTMRAAKAGFTDIETVASAGIATMMSSGKDINQVYDVLFQTVKEGNAEFKDIARYLPKVIPLARSVGYELEATAGAYASLTTKLSAEQSSTALEGIMRTLSNADVAMGKMDSKTGKYVSGFRSIGMNIFDSAGKIRPLIDIVKELNESFDGLTNEQKIAKLSKLGFDQATAVGFGTLMQDVAGLEKATRATSFAQGSLNKAYMDSLTPMEKWGVIQNNIKASMIKLGERILPYVTAALEKIAPMFQWMYQNIDIIIPLVGTFIGVLGGLSAAIWVVNFAMAMNPVGWVVLGISALIAIIVLAIAKYDEWGATLLWFLGPIGRVISALKLIYDHWDSIKKAFQDGGILGGLERIGQVLTDVLLQPIEQLLGLLGKLPGSLGAAARDMQGQVRSFREKMNLVETPAEALARSQAEGYAAMKAGGFKSEGEMWAANEAKKNGTNSLYDLPDATKGGGISNITNAEKGKKKISKDVDKITGAAKEVKNITIKFDSVHRGDNIINNGGGGKGMSMTDFENFYNELMMRIIRNAETS